MDNIGKINGFGGYHVASGQQGLKNKNNDQQPKEMETKAGSQNKEVSTEEFLNAMDMVSSQYQAFITPKANTGVNSIKAASDLLGAERVNDIEAMMAEFENGVSDIADFIDEEYPDMFSDETRNALAAEAFVRAQE